MRAKVPSNMIIKEIPTIIKTGTYNHTWIGIVGAGLTPDIAQSLSLPRNSKRVVVASIQSGSSAEKAGLHGINQNNSSNTQKDTVNDDSFTVSICPMCNKDNSVSLIPLQKNEAYRISKTNVDWIYNS